MQGSNAAVETDLGWHLNPLQEVLRASVPLPVELVLDRLAQDLEKLDHS
jgi:hypothetical protein